jgi:hypothetical protein
MGGKIVASAVLFLDLEITDAITNKHRRYPASYVVCSFDARVGTGSWSSAQALRSLPLTALAVVRQHVDPPLPFVAIDGTSNVLNREYLRR